MYIYGLVDPFSHQVRYVGVAKDPYKRLRQHMSERHAHTPKGQWIARLRDGRITPTLVLLERVKRDDNPFERERWWIGAGHIVGWPLTNEIPANIERDFTIALLYLLARTLADRD